MFIYFCFRLLMFVGFDLLCELIDICIKEFDLYLFGGCDVVVCYFFFDKCYYVVCCKFGCKVVNGLLVDVEKYVLLFIVDICWSIDVEVVLCYCVEYVVFDVEYDVVSDYMLLWCDEVFNYFFGQSILVMQVLLMELMCGNVLQIEWQDVFCLLMLRFECLCQGNVDVNQYFLSCEQVFYVKVEQISYGLV